MKEALIQKIVAKKMAKGCRISSCCGSANS